MAATATKMYSDLILTEKLGVDKKGKEITKRANVGKLMPSAKDQDVFDVVTELEKVMEYPVNDIQKVDHSLIVNE